jgi:hypothetical protein
MRICLILLIIIFLFSCKEDAVPLHTPYLRNTIKTCPQHNVIYKTESAQIIIKSKAVEKG